MNGDGSQQHIAIAGVMLLGVQRKAIPKGGKKSVGDLPQGVAGVFAVTDFYPAHCITSIVSCRLDDMRKTRHATRNSAEIPAYVASRRAAPEACAPGGHQGARSHSSDIAGVHATGESALVHRYLRRKVGEAHVVSAPVSGTGSRCPTVRRGIHARPNRTTSRLRSPKTRFERAPQSAEASSRLQGLAGRVPVIYIGICRSRDCGIGNTTAPSA